MAAKPAPQTTGGLRWEIHPPGTDYTMVTDDFTLDEIEAIEEQTGVPWLLLDPARNLKVARAYITMACIRAGIPDEEIPGRISTIGDLHGVLTLVPARPTALKAVRTGTDGGAAVPPTSASS
jgi:hypothetical protein